MNEYKIRYASSAIEDLQGIGHYFMLEWEDFSAAKRLIDAICDEIGKLNQLPRRFQIVETSPWKETNTHRMVFKNHLIYYQIDEANKCVYILRVLSCRQDIQNIKN